MDSTDVNEILEPRKWTTADPATGGKNNYAGDDMNGWTICTRNRDADALTRSNFEVIEEDMGDACEVHRTGHWACGWVEWLILPYTASEEDKEKAAQWIHDLEQYPVANDEHFSNLEYTEAEEYWRTTSMKDRLDLAERFGLSPFVIRRDEMPETSSGELCTWN